jgi:hypothetical protein
MTAAWQSKDRAVALPRVTEELAAEGVSRAELESALGDILDAARAEGVDEDSEEIILALGDRLHGLGWCSPDREIHSHESPVSAAPGLSLLKEHVAGTSSV